MSYININNPSIPFSYEELVFLNKNTSFPPGEEFEPPIPYARVLPTTKPTYDLIYQTVEEDIAVLVGGAWYQQWKIVDLLTPISAPEVSRELAKKARAYAVDNIKVTTSAGHTFDGDETSQTRMARAILVLSGTESTIPWILANNTTVLVNASELKEALLLAGTEQSRIWMI